MGSAREGKGVNERACGSPKKAFASVLRNAMPQVGPGRVRRTKKSWRLWRMLGGLTSTSAPCAQNVVQAQLQLGWYKVQRMSNAIRRGYAASNKESSAVRRP